MHVQRIAERTYRAWLISGPHHHLLEVELCTDPAATPRREVLPPCGECRHEPLREPELVAFVLQGIASANARLGTSFGAARIAWTENDTRPEAAYGALAAGIVETAARDASSAGVTPAVT